MDNENCAMNKIEQLENEGYERLPNSEEDVTLAVKHNEINIQHVIETSANKNKINLNLSQEQIFTIHTLTSSSSFELNVNRERLSNQSFDLKKSIKTISENPITVPLLAVNSERLMNGNSGKLNDFSELSEFSMTENEKNNLLRKFSVSAIESSNHHHHRGETSLFNDFHNTHNAKVLEQEFKCSICNDGYEDPRVLDCLHSFCLNCLADVELVKYHKSKTNDLCELDLSCE